MKVLFISAANSVHTVKWVNGLLLKGCEVHLAYLKNHGPVKDIDKGVFLHPLPFSNFLGYYANAIALRKIYTSITPDIVNVHYASGYGTLARISKIPYVLSVWGSDVCDFPFKSNFNFRMVKKNLSQAIHITSTSYCMIPYMKKILPCINEISVVPFGVDLELFKPMRKYKSNEKNEIIIGTIKILSNKYGIQYAIKGVSNYIKNLSKSERNKIKYYIYGDGPDKAKLNSLIINENMQNHIFLKGKISNSDVPKALNELDVFLVTSDKESFGVAVVEAMACGIPVIATEVDGFKEVTNDGETAILIERKNVSDITSALNSIFVDKKMLRNMSVLGRKRVEQLYNWDKNIDQMIDVYNKIINGNTKRLSNRTSK